MSASTRAALGPEVPVRSLRQVEVKRKTRKIALDAYGGP